MTNKFKLPIISGTAAFFCALACVGPAAQAKNDSKGEKSAGTGSLDLKIAMVRTAAAPAEAKLKASLEADDQDGATDAKLKLEAVGLLAGTYSVSATLKSTGGTVALGTFAVVDGAEVEFEFGNDEGMPFATAFDPFDLSTLTIADANNVVLFTADLSQVKTAEHVIRNASVQATAGPNYPNATGVVTLSAKATKGVTKGKLVLTGIGLPAKAKLTFVINGRNVRKVNVDKYGRLNVNAAVQSKTGQVAAGVTLFSATSVEVRDASGAVVLTASF